MTHTTLPLNEQMLLLFVQKLFENTTMVNDYGPDTVQQTFLWQVLLLFLQAFSFLRCTLTPGHAILITVQDQGYAWNNDNLFIVFFRFRLGNFFGFTK